MNSRMILGGAAITLYFSVAFGAFKIQKVRNRPEPPLAISDPSFQRQYQYTDCYSNISSEYDNKVSTDEWILNMAQRRKELVENLQGRVLEVSAGTGRNLHLYPTENLQIVITDNSEPMLQMAKKKYTEILKSRRPKVMFSVQNAEKLQFDNESFDHTVDTFGLCSYEDPVAALKEMARVTKPDGTIRLLEHGRSGHGMINEFLDKSALERSQHWGCWWNRDIKQLVSSAGLKIVEHRLYHFGTTSLIVAKKS